MPNPSHHVKIIIKFESMRHIPAYLLVCVTDTGWVAPQSVVASLLLPFLHTSFILPHFPCHFSPVLWILKTVLRGLCLQGKIFTTQLYPWPPFLLLFINCYFFVICSHLLMHISFEPYSAIQQSLKLHSPSLQHLNQWPIPPDQDATFIDLFY